MKITVIGQALVIRATVYASAVSAMSACLSVRHKSQFYWNGWMYRASFRQQMLPSAYPTMCHNGVWVSEIRVLLSGTLSQTELSRFSALSSQHADRRKCCQLSIYHTERPLCLQHVCCGAPCWAGLSATDDETCQVYSDSCNQQHFGSELKCSQ